MTCQDWRDASPDEVAPLYAAERERWLTELAWDPAELLDVVERGRLAGHVAGWIAFDQEDRPSGWTFYILHDAVLQIGGLVGERPSVVRRLLDAVLASPEARSLAACPASCSRARPGPPARSSASASRCASPCT